MRVLGLAGLDPITPWGCKVIEISGKQQRAVAGGNGNLITIGGACAPWGSDSEKAALAGTDGGH